MHAHSRPALAHNLHTHTTFSDGAYPPEQVVAAAINGGLAMVGLCDHLHSAKLGDTGGVRPAQMAAYLKQCRQLADSCADRIAVRVGLEISLSASYTNLSAIPWPRRPFDPFDYILVEDLWPSDPQGLKLQDLCRLREHIGVPVGLAHCDLAPYCSAMPLETLVKLLARHRLFVELCPSPRNAHWMPAELMPGQAEPSGDLVPIPYYRAAAHLYRRLAGQGVQVGIGTDTHEDLRNVTDIADAATFIRENGLENQLVADELGTVRK